MKTLWILAFLFIQKILTQKTELKNNGDYSKSENDAVKWLIDSNNEILKLAKKKTTAMWKYSLNRTEKNELEETEASSKLEAFQTKMVKSLADYDWKRFSDELIKHQMEKISKWNIYVPSAERYKYDDIVYEMKDTFEEFRICGSLKENPSCLPNYQPDLISKMGTSKNSTELLITWKTWHDSIGKRIRPLYENLIDAANADAKNRGFINVTEEWVKEFKIPRFDTEIHDLYIQIYPLYEQMFTYVRKRLKQIYPEINFPSDDSIPAHLLGDMWAMHWTDIFKETIPFKQKSVIDLTKLMHTRKLSIKVMYKTAEDFYHSLGFPKLSHDFWSESIFVKPLNSDVDCSGKSYDFYDEEHYRLLACTTVSYEDWKTVFSLIGYLIYAQAYKNQPYVFRNPAFSLFQYSVSEAIILSAFSTKHLAEIKLLKKEIQNDDYYLNSLYKLALQKVTFLPYAYVSDYYRWNVFNGAIEKKNLNSRWWELRHYFSGISPPEKRSEEYFDPAGKFHFPSHEPYIHYFLNNIIQFQIHKHLCTESGHKGPLHTCDIFKSKKAGNILREAMKLGDSKSWRYFMQKFTGTTRIDASALMEYFQPLMTWLEKENANENIGWQFD